MQTQSIWTILLTYTFVQGYLMTAFALIKLRKVFLSGLLFIVSTLILASLYERFDWYKEVPALIWTAAPLWYVLGPCLYFFVKQQFSSRIQSWEYLVHAIPFLLFLIYIFPFYLLDDADKIEIYERIFSRETYSGDPNHYLFSAHIIFYVFLSIWKYRVLTKERKSVSAESNFIFDEFIIRVLRYYSVYSIVAVLFYVAVDAFHTYVFNYHSVNYLFLSAVVHLMGFYVILREQGGIEVVEKEGKYVSSSLREADMNNIIDKLLPYISKSEVYSNANLRLRNVAEQVGVPPYQISQSISTVLNKSFFDLVNEVRVNSVKVNLTNPRYKNYTLVAIAHESGFKSPSSFYRIFKKHTGKTPKEFMMLQNAEVDHSRPLSSKSTEMTDSSTKLGSA